MIMPLKKNKHTNNNPNDFIDYVILKYEQFVIKNLDKIFESYAESKDKEKLVSNLEKFLKINWEIVKGSLLCYTALPTHRITEHLCKITEYVENQTGKASINVLMPTIKCDSFSPTKHPNLDETDLENCIKTHIYIRAESYDYLVPVSLLTDISIDFEYDRLPNCYYELPEHEGETPNFGIPSKIEFNDSAYLSDVDTKRLVSHSEKTQAIWDTREKYFSTIAQEPSLLEKLTMLAQKLSINGRHYRGRDAKAAEGVYLDIIAFIEYSDQLKPENIPAPVKILIDRIKKVTSTTEKVEEGERCIAALSEDVRKLIGTHAKNLAVVRINSDTKNNQAMELRDKFEDKKEDLKRVVTNGQYSGKDSLGLTLSVIQTLGIDLERLNDFETFVRIFKYFNAADVAYLQREGISRNFTMLISTAENFIDFFAQVDPLLFKEFLISIRDDITTSILKKQGDLIAILMDLKPESCRIFCRVLNDKLSSFIKGVQEVEQLFKHLPSDKCVVVFDELKEVILPFVKSAQDFACLFQHFPLNQRFSIFNEFKKIVLSLIKDAQDFRTIFQHFSADQRIIIFEELKNRIRVLIKNPQDLAIILQPFLQDDPKILRAVFRFIIEDDKLLTIRFLRSFFCPTQYGIEVKERNRPMDKALLARDVERSFAFLELLLEFKNKTGKRLNEVVGISNRALHVLISLKGHPIFDVFPFSDFVLSEKPLLKKTIALKVQERFFELIDRVDTSSFSVNNVQEWQKATTLIKNSWELLINDIPNFTLPSLPKNKAFLCLILEQYIIQLNERKEKGNLTPSSFLFFREGISIKEKMVAAEKLRNIVGNPWEKGQWNKLRSLKDDPALRNGRLRQLYCHMLKLHSAGDKHSLNEGMCQLTSKGTSP
ncbi:hypothetical cytosolic protein [Coxiella burnetii Dugway 5J108-111]|uniref:Hypothetical cytosolic protein n=1 Tax=Coxiella burnetii (strain Dugway 5J108-111) TaxID=434922 RepID=A9KGA8_COXBN|nr:hypothetical cytosolic protein [Coxiella burnetii Dugway 5J108-111]